MSVTLLTTASRIFPKMLEDTAFLFSEEPESSLVFDKAPVGIGIAYTGRRKANCACGPSHPSCGFSPRTCWESTSPIPTSKAGAWMRLANCSTSSWAIA